MTSRESLERVSSCHQEGDKLKSNLDIKSRSEDVSRREVEDLKLPRDDESSQE